MNDQVPKDPLALTSAWRLATQLVRQSAGALIEETAGSPGLAVRAGGRVVVEMELAGSCELRSVALPPIPRSDWAWPMPDQELRRLCTTLGSTARLEREPSSKHKRLWLTGMVITRVVGRLALSGTSLDVYDARREGAPVPRWLARRDDLRGIPSMDDEPAPVWAVEVGGDVVGALFDGWLLTPAGESINLFARFLGGASVEELANLAAGRPPLSEETPPGVVDLPDGPFDRNDDRWARVLYSFNSYERLADLGGPEHQRLAEILARVHDGTLDAAKLGTDVLRGALFFLERGCRHQGAWDDADVRVAAALVEALCSKTDGRLRVLP